MPGGRGKGESNTGTDHLASVVPERLASEIPLAPKPEIVNRESKTDDNANEKKS